MWLTNKKTGARFNTDWLDSEQKVKEDQIARNADTAKQVEQNERINDLAKLSAAEYRTAIKNLPVEHLRVVDSRGKTVIADISSGLNDKCFIPDDVVGKLRDSTLIHNHPHGSCLSDDDIKLMCNNDMQGIEAVANDSNIYDAPESYILSRIDGSEGLKNSSRFAIDYKQAELKYKADVVDNVWKHFDSKEGGATLEDANACNKMVNEFKRKWLKDNSEKYGYKYSEKKRR